MDSISVLKEILKKNEQIQSLRFFKFATNTKLQSRLLKFDEFENDLVNKTIDFKIKNNVRFWNALLSILIKNKITSTKLLVEALYHQPNKNYDYVNVVSLDAYLNSHEYDNCCLAINSKVELLNGDTGHIPLLDFKLPSKNNNDKLAIDTVKALGLCGYLLDSGKSYHFIGNQILSENELIDLLAKFILLDPISDKAWASHQLIERSASVRISKRNNLAPKLIAEM